MTACSECRAIDRAPQPNTPQRLPRWTPPLGHLSPTARRTLVIMLAGPLESRPRGWCRIGDFHVVAPSRVMKKLRTDDLATTWQVGSRQRARLTPRGRIYARAAAAREADLRMAGALTGFDRLQDHAAKDPLSKPATA